MKSVNLIFKALLITLALGIFLPNLSYAQAGAVRGVDYLENTIIFKLNADSKEYQEPDGIGHDDFEKITVFYGIQKLERMFPRHSSPTEKLDPYGHPYADLSLIYVYEYTKTAAEGKVINDLLSTGIFEYVQLYPLSQPTYIPNDSAELLAKQYYLETIKAYDAWDICKGDTNIVIGVTDSGTDFDHPDLNNNIKFNYSDPVDGIDNDNDGYIDNFRGYDLGENDAFPQASNLNHGIVVSGISSAHGDNGIGITGVGLRCKYLPIKVDNANGVFVAEYQSIVYAADHGCQVINCSWGSKFYAGQFGQDIITYATINRDALVIAAAGNENDMRPYYPASYDYVINVLGSDVYDIKGSYSSYGPTIDVSAPGTAIFTTYGPLANVSKAYNWQGGATSYASPVVAGVAAVTRAYFPHYTAIQIGERLRNTADRVDTLDFMTIDSTFTWNDTLIDTNYHSNAAYLYKMGQGRVNMLNALAMDEKPGVRFRNLTKTDGNDDLFRPGDTISIGMEFFNYLDTAHNLNISIQTDHPLVGIFNPNFSAGQLLPLSGVNNYQNPFRLFLFPNSKPNDSIIVRVDYYEGSSLISFEYLILTINPDFLRVDYNELDLTISSNSRFCYSDYYSSQVSPFNAHGYGFSYKNNDNLMYTGSLVAGISNIKVSDNIASLWSPDNYLTFDKDFTAVELLEDSIVSSYFANGSFSDMNAGGLKLYLDVDQQVRAWNTPGREDFVIVRYFIINSGSTALTNLYLSLYTDMDVRYAGFNKLRYDALKNLSYTYMPGYGPYCGVQLLNVNNPNHYAFDNNGALNSININDGFTSFEKYDALRWQRAYAGDSLPEGNDVSSMLGVGPITVLPGDTVELAYAIHATDNLTFLQQNAVEAKIAYQQIDVSVDDLKKNSVKIKVWPNPCSDILYAKVFNAENRMAVTIKDVQGKIWKRLELNPDGTSQVFQIETASLPAGIYFINLVTENGVQVSKFVKN